MQPSQKYLYVFLGIFGLGCVYLIFQSVAHTPRTVNYAARMEQFRDQGVPDFTLPVVTERNATNPAVLKLSDLKKPLVLINFWATWCAPCVIEFPALVKLAAKYKDKGLVIVAASLDENTGPVQDFLLTRGPAKGQDGFIVVSDPGGKVAAQFGTSKIPETYIVGPGRKLIMKSIDQQDWMAPDFLAFIDKQLGATP